MAQRVLEDWDAEVYMVIDKEYLFLNIYIKEREKRKKLELFKGKVLFSFDFLINEWKEKI